ncbi:MAG: type II toxin-antitoxin system VapC family toxin [Vicinamibacterales bacterium]
MKLLLDTHVWLWLKTDPQRLPSPVRRKLASDSASLYLSAACVMEISIKQTIGKLKIGATTTEFVEELLAKGALPAVIEIEHAMVAGSLPPHHRDPFDRTLIAQAQVEGLTLVTADPRILKYDIPTLDARK